MFSSHAVLGFRIKVILALQKRLKSYLPFAIVKTGIFWKLKWNHLILECVGELACLTQ